MPKRFALALFAILAAAVCRPALAYDYSPAALAVLERSRAATGGSGWNSLRGWTETGTLNGVRYSLWVDPVRYGYRFEMAEAGGRRALGYNGVGDWEISPKGNPTGHVDRGSLARARTLGFFGGYGFFFPHRFAAKGSLIGTRPLDGRSYDVLTVRPADGLARELWFDRGTRFLSRVIDRNGAAVITYELSDYRQVGPVKAPFRIVVDDGDPQRRQVRVVESLGFETVDRALFSLPRPPAAPASR